MSVSPSPFNPFWSDLKNKRIVVVGAGRTGLSVIDFLLPQQCDITLWDDNQDIKLPAGILSKLDKVILGFNEQPIWQDIDGVVISPGISPHNKVLKPAFDQHIPVIGDIELFAIALQQKNTKPKVIGVTGSNGKSTVTLLLEHIFNTAGKTALAGGNIGTPALALLDTDVDIIVLELSSFQLEMTASLQLDIACFLNLSEDHLDRHGTYTQYMFAKQRIYRNALFAVFWYDQKETHPTSPVHRQYSFSVTKDSSANLILNEKNDIVIEGNFLVYPEKSNLVGLHNILNIQAAVAAALELAISCKCINAALSSFIPPQHRCVTISQKNDVYWIDDSKATNPGATLAAINGIGPLLKGRLLLLAGGDAKGANVNVLAKAIVKYVSVLIVFGKDAQQFTQFSVHTIFVSTLNEGVYEANRLSNPKDTVLLSPACASLDMFTNYIHRAQVYSDAIGELCDG